MIVNMPDLAQMLGILNAQLPRVMKLVTALSYVTGFFMLLSSVFKFKQYGDHRGSASADIKTPLLLLVGGALLLFFPSIVHMGVQTLWNYNNPLNYTNGAASGEQTASMKAIINIVKVLGVVTAVRGIHLLSKAGSQGQPSLVSKGLTHVIGGILAINIYGTWMTLTHSLGLSIS